jgi:hypothetical protein
MIRSSIRRSVSAAVAVLALPATMLLTAGPAEAGSMFFSKSSGRTAYADWLEVGTLPGGVPGNIHFGFMQIEDLGNGRANIFGNVTDLTCPDGYIPEGPGGGHDEEPGEDPCTYEGDRFIEGGSTVFTMDRKFNTATLTGNLAVFGHDGSTGNPAVDMTFTGIGAQYSSTESGRYNDGTTSYRYRYTFSGRDAIVSGRIGAMIFDNVPGEWSFAQMGSFRSMDRERTR